jgi:hypothetical protein
MKRLFFILNSHVSILRFIAKNISRVVSSSVF